MADTKIAWATKVWNPTTGCSKISAGCQNCYAEGIAHRFWGNRKFTDIQIHPERLQMPWQWRKPQRIFVDSMSDLFHEDIPFEFIFHVFMHMLPSAANKWANHIFMILTKRPERMAAFIEWMTTEKEGSTIEWPLPNIWLGVTAENQEMANKRISILLSIPAAIRFVSVEPMLGPVDFTDMPIPFEVDNRGFNFNALTNMDDEHFYNIHSKIDWVIVGGESGPNARPMHPDWVRSIRDQCQSAGVPFFFKQWGEFITSYDAGFRSEETDKHKRTFGDCWVKSSYRFEDGLEMVRVGSKMAGYVLDGGTYHEFPGVK